MEFKVNYNQREQATEVSGYITDSELHGEKEYIKRTVLNNLSAKIAEHLFKRIEPTLNDLFKENVYPEITECILEKCKELKEQFNYSYDKASEFTYTIALQVLNKYSSANISSVVFLIKETLKKVYSIQETGGINQYIYERCRELIRGYKNYQEAESFVETITKEAVNKFPNNDKSFVKFTVRDILKEIYSQ